MRGQLVVFFPSLAHRSADGTQWILQLRGRTFHPATDSWKRTQLIEALADLADIDTDADACRHFEQVAGDWVSESVRGRRLRVRLGPMLAELPASDAAGHVAGEIALPAAQAERLAVGGRIAYATAEGAIGQVTLLEPGGVLVISDMDDTIKHTAVLDRREMVRNTFARPFRAAGGMPELYRRWADALGASIHFHLVSAGPWQLHRPLLRFTQARGFPDFTWDMRRVRTSRIADLTADSCRYKVQTIESLAARFPARRLVLVGDSGERDPEVYATILARHPAQVERVLIREVGEAPGRDWQRLYGADAPLQRFSDPARLPVPGGTIGSRPAPRAGADFCPA